MTVWMLALHIPIVIHACTMSGKTISLNQKACCCSKSVTKQAHPSSHSKAVKSNCHRPKTDADHTSLAPPAQKGQPHSSIQTYKTACCHTAVPNVETEAGIFDTFRLKDLAPQTSIFFAITWPQIYVSTSFYAPLPAPPPPIDRQAILCTYRN